MPETLPAERKVSTTEVAIEQVGGGGMLLPHSMAEAIRFGEVMAKGGVAVPKHCRDQPGVCFGIVMQALRWEMDPFAVANKSYSVSDRLAYEAQLVAAVVHTRAPIARRPDYAFVGEPGTTRRCIVSCEMLDGTTKVYESPEVGRITTKNSPLWKSDEDQQLGYFAIRSWARRYTPEVILGVYTPDEAAEMRDIAPRDSGLAARLTGSTSGFSRDHVEAETAPAVDAEIEPVEPPQTPTEAKVADDPAEAAQDAESAPPEPPQSWTAWEAELKAKIIKAKTADAGIAVWKANIEKIKEAYDADRTVYDSLDSWMQDRIKTLRSREKQDLTPKEA